MPMLFLAGGSGLSSPSSMIVDLMAEGYTLPFTLVNGARLDFDLRGERVDRSGAAYACFDFEPRAVKRLQRCRPLWRTQVRHCVHTLPDDEGATIGAARGGFPFMALGFRRPVLGMLAAVVTIGIALGVSLTFTPTFFGGWVGLAEQLASLALVAAFSGAV
jgi:hypothetical protein